MATKIQDFSPNFLNNQLLNILLQILATEPTAIQGKIFLDSAESAVKVSLDGVDWTTLATLDDLASAGVSLEQVIDSLGTTVLTEGSNISITYDDAANGGTGGITIDVTGLGSAAFTSSGDYDAAGSAASAQAFAIQRANHTGTQPASSISDLTETVQDVVGALIGDSATVDVVYDDGTNSIVVNVIDSPTVDGNTPAQLRARSSHTGTQLSTTISDFAAAVADKVGGMVSGNTETGITVTYQDGDETLDFVVTDSPLLGGQNSAWHRNRANHTGTQTSSTISDFVEAVQDAVGTLIGDSSTIDVTYDDVANTLTIAVLDSPTVGGNTAAQLRDRATHTGTQAPSTIAGLAEYVADEVGAMFSGNTETGITVTYQDADNTIDLVVTDSPLLGGKSSAFHLNRANHTGTQPSATISDFNSSVQALVDAEIAALVDSAPGTLDTLNEIAAALGDDPNFSATITAALALRNQTYSTTYGDGTAKTFNINHGLGTRNVTVNVFDTSSYAEIDVPITHTTVNQITIEHTSTPGAGQYRVVVQGRGD